KGFVAGLIPELISKPLQEIAALPHIRQAFEQLYQQHLKFTERIRTRAELKDGVLFFDVSDQDAEGYNKFAPYYLFPAAVYCVAISRSRERTKIAVGSNPWNPTPKTTNLATISERFGGGGHAKHVASSIPEKGEIARGSDHAAVGSVEAQSGRCPAPPALRGEASNRGVAM